MRALVGKEKTFGADHTLTLGTVNNLGILFADQGKLREAEEMYVRALAGNSTVSCLDRRNVRIYSHNIGHEGAILHMPVCILSYEIA